MQKEIVREALLNLRDRYEWWLESKHATEKERETALVKIAELDMALSELGLEQVVISMHIDEAALVRTSLHGHGDRAQDTGNPELAKVLRRIADRISEARRQMGLDNPA
jgi:hypothetical protein